MFVLANLRPMKPINYFMRKTRAGFKNFWLDSGALRFEKPSSFCASDSSIDPLHHLISALQMPVFFFELSTHHL